MQPKITLLPFGLHTSKGLEIESCVNCYFLALDTRAKAIWTSSILTPSAFNETVYLWPLRNSGWGRERKNMGRKSTRESFEGTILAFAGGILEETSWRNLSGWLEGGIDPRTSRIRNQRSTNVLWRRYITRKRKLVAN